MRIPRKSPEPTYKRLATAALAWLSGEEIDADAATRLGLKVEGQESAALADDQAVEQVLLALAHLAQIRDQPFVLCIDQVDNLDHDKLKALARFLHALLDHASNMLVIVSGVKETLLDFREDGIIPEAAWDRIAEYKVELPRIHKDDARKILEARLERFHEPFMELDPVRRHLQEDTLFPLGRTWLDGQLGDGREFRARDILIWARDAWDDEQAKLSSLGAEEWLEKWPHDGQWWTMAPPPDPTSVSLEETIDAMVDPQGRGAGRPAPAATGEPAPRRREPGGPGARPAGAVPGRGVAVHLPRRGADDEEERPDAPLRRAGPRAPRARRQGDHHGRAVRHQQRQVGHRGAEEALE